MKPYQWIVGLALLPRALHTAWILLVALGVLLWVIIPGTCSALVNPAPAAIVDATVLEQVIADKTAKLAPAVLEYGPPPPPEPEGCFIADLKSICCPQFCQARNSVKYFDRADRIYETCAKSLCDGRDHPGHIVCDCTRGKP